MTSLVIEADTHWCGDQVRTWRAEGRRVVVARHGTEMHGAGDDHILDLTDRRQVELLLADLRDESQLQVVHAAAGPPEPVDLAGVEHAMRTALLPLLHLARVLGRRWSTADGCSLYVLTAGAADTGDGATASALIGLPAVSFALSLRHEFPALRVCATDLADPLTSADIDAALSRKDDLGFLALRGGQFLERVIEPVERSDQGSEPDQPPGGTYVVTGGLGGVGREVVDVLRRHTAAPIALLQRRPPGPEARAAIENWSRVGPTVAYQADVTDRDSLHAALDRVRAELSPVGAVVHAAGILVDGLARTKDEAALAAVLAPKIRGAWLLDELTTDDPVQAFVLFSSTVALYGAPGQSDYAAANAFLAAFASYRGSRRPGSTQALHWSMWQATGMARQLPDGVTARRAEIIPLEPVDAAHAYLAAMGVAEPALVVERRSASATRHRLLGPVRAATTSSRKAADHEDAGLDAVARALALVVDSAARLGVACADRPGDDFFALGLDSGGLLELAAAISARLDIELYPTSLFEFPTPRALAEHLASTHTAALAGTPAAGEPEQPGRAATAGPGPGAMHDLVAIVGYDCRLPGAGTAEELWPVLSDGVVAYGAAPAERLPVAAGAAPVAGLLDDVAGFDPLLFKIAPKDAELIDPQHRLALECCWHALERAGHSGSRAGGTHTGVFLGVMNSEYEIEAVRRGIDLKAATGTSRAMLANAVSYALDLTGPSMTVETACSSSLVAVHQAARALVAGEVDLALAGGVNVLAAPSVSQAYLAAGLLSPTGHCRPFDQRADGYVRGEGVGVVVLRRFVDAVADGDRIHAVILGSAVGHSGQGNGLGAPHPQGQADVVTAAMTAAGVAPADIGYVETHGTGTALGDPVELRGLVRSLGAAPTPCLLSSIKGNVGHLESAAGIASLIKVLLCFEHDAVSPIAGLDETNPLLELSGQRFRLADESVPWPRGDRPRLAGVSSFGFGGTNCHVVLMEPPEQPPAGPDVPGPELVLLSARTPAALRQRAADLTAHLAQRPQVRLGDVARTLAAGRRHLPTRRALVVASTAELRTRLRDHSRRHAPSRPQHRLALELGPVTAEVDMAWLAARSEAARREFDRWPAGNGVGAACAVVRWLAEAGLPITRVKARGTGLVAAGVLAGVLDPSSVLAGVTVDRGDMGAIPWPELTGRPRGPVSTWSVWLAQVTAEPVAERADADLRWSPDVGADARRELLTGLGLLYERDTAADWSVIAPPGRRLPLPVYPFERQRFWCLDEPGDRTSADRTPEERESVQVMAPRWLPAGRAAGVGARDSATTPATVLVFAPDGPLADELPRSVRADGARCVVVRPGSAYARTNRDRYTLRMRERADHQRLLADLEIAGGEGLSVLFLPALAARRAGEPDVTRACRLCAELAATFDALREVAAPHPVRLLVTTVGAAGIGAPSPTPLDAALLGLVTVLAQEEPRLRVHAYDLDHGTANTMSELVDLVGRPRQDDAEVNAIRAGRTLVRQLAPVPGLRAAGGPTPSAWWVTGGLGGLGLAIAEALPGDRVPLVLTGRRLLPDHDQWQRLADDPTAPLAALARRLCDLRRNGREVLVLSGDVSVSDDVAAMRATVRDRFGPGYGIVHAAGMPGRGARAHQLSQADFHAVFAAKVAGAVHLDSHTRQDDVAQFVLVSSLAAVAGGWGLGDYAAANAALDAVGHARQEIGLPAVVVNWTAVRGVGMAATAKVRLPEGISVNDAMSVLPLALSGVLPRLVVGRSDRRAPPAVSVAAPPAAPMTEPNHFLDTLAATLGTDPIDVDRRASLVELGLDSRAQLVFLSELERELGVDLPLDLLGQPVPVATLAERVDQHVAEERRTR